MLKVKQPPAVAVIVPASGDIESGTVIATDEAVGPLNPSADSAPALAASIAQAAEEAIQTPESTQLTHEESRNAPRAVVLSDAAD